MKMIENKTCKVCGVELSEDNWVPSGRKRRDYCCKKCTAEYNRLRCKANPEKSRASTLRWSRKRGVRPFNENKDCSSYLGVHIAERVLSHVFKDVERMPMNNPGYDIICNHNKTIDIKSSCPHKRYKNWAFRIKRNTTADYFLCLAFDSREDLNPLHAWLIPGSELNHLKNTSISPSTVHKWDEYRLDISKISDCCNSLRSTKEIKHTPIDHNERREYEQEIEEMDERSAAREAAKEDD